MTTTSLSTKTGSSNNPYSANPHLSTRSDTTFVNNSLLIQNANNGKPGNASIDSLSSNNNHNHRNLRNCRTINNNRSPRVNNNNNNNRNANNNNLNGLPQPNNNNMNMNNTNINANNNTTNTNNNNRNRHNAATPTINTPPAQLVPTPYPHSNITYYNPRLIGTTTISPLSNTRQTTSPTSTRSVHHPTLTTITSSSVVLPVASHLIGGVIGRGGRNIQEIRRQTNAEIKIDNERQNQTAERYITINGTPQQISTAVQMIQNSLTTTHHHSVYP